MKQPQAQTTQTLVVLMENEAGVLSNLIGLFSQRALNIESLTVVRTEEDRTLSKMTLETLTEKRTMELLAKQIDRLVDVIDVELLSSTVGFVDESKAAA